MSAWGLVEELIKRHSAKGLSELEVYASKTRALNISVARDRVVEVSHSVDMDVGVRGAIGRRVGGLRLNTLEVDPGEVLDKVASIARATPEDEHWPGFPPRYEPLVSVEAYDPRVAERREEDYLELLGGLISRIKEPALARGVESAVVVEGGLGVRVVEAVVANTSGVYRELRATSVSIWLVLDVSKAGAKSDYSMYYLKSRLDLEELDREALRAGERALLFFNAEPLESGVYDVVLCPWVAGEIVQFSLAPAFSGLNILENRSPLRGRLGEGVFNERLTLIDDPTVPGALGTRSFDDEGVPARRKEVVSRGVFTTILHSYYTARRMGAEPTGNGLRAHPAAQPLPGFLNLYVAPGSGSLESFANELRRGIVVYEVIGHWMSDPFTGSIKATVTHGVLVESGAPVKPVKGVVLGGNIYDWLSKSLVEVGSDIEVHGNIASPTIWIREVKVAGKSTH